MDYAPQVVSIRGVEGVAAAFDFRELMHPDAWLALLTFLYTDVLDTTGCLYTVARQVGTRSALAEREYMYRPLTAGRAFNPYWSQAGIVQPDGSFEGER